MLLINNNTAIVFEIIIVYNIVYVYIRDSKL